MEQKLLETAFKTFTEEFIKNGKEIFSEAEKELLHLLKINLKKYLNKQKEKFSTIKTILQGSTPVFLYDYYFPLRLIENTYSSKYRYSFNDINNEEHSIPTSSISTLFNSSAYITIMGDAGSGKTTLVKHLFLNCIQEKYAVPFLLELRYLNEYAGTIDEYIISKLFENDIAESYRIVSRMLENGKFVFFLDGFDEINSNIKSKIVKDLDEFITRYQKNKYILTSRPYSNIEHFQKFKNFNVCRLNETEINHFVIKQLPKEKELSAKIIHSIKENRNQYIKTFLTNPLLLSLYILTYQSNSEIPPKKYIFYRRVIQALFSEHDSKSKIGFRRERKTDLTQEQFEEILKRFSFLSFFDSKYDFEYDYIIDILKKIKDKLIHTNFENNSLIDDLKSALALWVEDNGFYAFAHRSMQEYYVANFVKRLDNLNKEKIYQKLAIRASGHLLSETENLLSLCEEMDPYYFYSYYKLPLLQGLESKLNTSNQEALTKSFVAHLIKEIAIDFNKDSGKDFSPLDFTFNSEISQYFYFDLKHMQDLYQKLSSFRVYISNKNTSKSKKFHYKISTQDFPDDVSSFCKTNDVDSLANSFLVWLKNEIKITLQFIEQTSKSNDELVAMI